MDIQAIGATVAITFGLISVVCWCLLKAASMGREREEGEAREEASRRGDRIVIPRYKNLTKEPASPAEPATTTPASREDSLGAAFMALVDAAEAWANEPAFTSPGSQASSSPSKTPGSSRLLGPLEMAELSHVASCSWCLGEPEALLSLSKTLARVASGRAASTSASEGTSSSAGPEPASATSGSRGWTRGGQEGKVLDVFGLSEGWETRCVEWEPLRFEFRRIAQCETEDLHRDQCVKPKGHSGDHEF